MKCPWHRGRGREAKAAADREAKAAADHRGPSPRDRGRAGERLAARYLAGQGLRILAQNWRFRGGEIDLVAEDGRDLVLVEVKMRARGARRDLPLGQLDRLARHVPSLASTFGRTEAAVVRIDIVWVEGDAGDRLGRVAEWMRGVDPETGAAMGPDAARPSWWRRTRSRLRFLSSGGRSQKGGRSRDPLGP